MDASSFGQSAFVSSTDVSFLLNEPASLVNFTHKLELNLIRIVKPFREDLCRVGGKQAVIVLHS